MHSYVAGNNASVTTKSLKRSCVIQAAKGGWTNMKDFRLKLEDDDFDDDSDDENDDAEEDDIEDEY